MKKSTIYFVVAACVIRALARPPALIIVENSGDYYYTK